MDSARLRLYLGMFAVTAVFTAIGVYGSGQTASLMLLAGAMHLCGDGIPYVADFYKERFPARKVLARRLKLAIVLSNAMFLFVTSAYIAWEAYHRFERPFLVSSWVLLFAIVDIVGNAMQVLIERKLKHARQHDHDRHVHHSQWGHLVGDIAASILQTAGAIAIVISGALWIDPVASAFGALLTLLLGVKGLWNYFALLMNPEKGHDHSHA